MTSIQLIDNDYEWKNCSLIQFLSEGNIPIEWKDFFIDNIEILQNISNSISSTKIIYPSVQRVFRAFYMTPLSNIKIVIVGQDCYHNGNATGLCFDVKNGSIINPSLKNIYKELKLEGFTPTEDGNLSHLPSQGVLLINAALTVAKGEADSHTAYWYPFTENLIKYISKNTHNISWLLMGKRAQEFKEYINSDTHKIVETSHPSPFSAMRGYGHIPSFINSDCFKQLGHDIRW
tara:strand:+ start:122 stop:820 length:699 start_codon:yes stop_codon:yes gene_type:complete